MLLVCGSARFSLPTLPVEDYPTLPDMPAVTGHAARARPSPPPSRRSRSPPVATTRCRCSPASGSRSTATTLTLAATDRYRLAVRELAWSPEQTGARGGRARARRAPWPTPPRRWRGCERCRVALAPVGVGEGLIGFEGGGRRRPRPGCSTVSSRSTARCCPSSRRRVADVDTAAFVEAVKRVALVAERNTPVRLSFTDGEVAARRRHRRRGPGDRGARGARSRASRSRSRSTRSTCSTAWARSTRRSAVLSFTTSTKPAVLTGGATGDGDGGRATTATCSCRSACPADAGAPRPLAPCTSRTCRSPTSGPTPEVELAARAGRHRRSSAPTGRARPTWSRPIGYVATPGQPPGRPPTRRSSAQGAERAVVRVEVVRDGRADPGRGRDQPRAGEPARVNRVAGAAAARGARPAAHRPVRAGGPRAGQGRPGERRRFLDDLLVARAPRLAGVRADYDRVLKQRNALLKSAAGAARAGPVGATCRPSTCGTPTWPRPAPSCSRRGCDLVATLAAAGREGLRRGRAPAAAPAELDATQSLARPDASSGAGPRRRSPRRCSRRSARLAASRARARGLARRSAPRRAACSTSARLPAKGYASHGESWSFALALRLASYDLLAGRRRRAGPDPRRRVRRARRRAAATRLAELVAPRRAGARHRRGAGGCPGRPGRGARRRRATGRCAVPDDPVGDRSDDADRPPSRRPEPAAAAVRDRPGAGAAGPGPGRRPRPAAGGPAERRGRPHRRRRPAAPQRRRPRTTATRSRSAARVERLVAERGWEAEAAVGGVIGRWPDDRRAPSWPTTACPSGFADGGARRCGPTRRPGRPRCGCSRRRLVAPAQRGVRRRAR